MYYPYVIESMRRELYGSIHITHVVTEEQGAEINRGEKFNIRYQVRNANLYLPCKLKSLRIRDTGYAEVVGSNNIISINEDLSPYEAWTSEEITLLAKVGIRDISHEQISTVIVNLDWQFEKLFENIQKVYFGMQDIQP